MALSTTKLSDIQTRIIADIENEIGQTIPLLSKSVFRVISYVYAALWITLYKFGFAIQKNIHPQTASEDALILQGLKLGVIRQPSTTFLGNAEIIVTAPQTLKANTQLISESGIVYLVKADVLLIVGANTIQVGATEGGEIGNLNVNDVLTFVVPPAGYSQTATITSVTTVGENQEEFETYRQRIINRWQKIPQGGAAVDYQIWSLEAPNVISAYPYPEADLNGVEVYIEVDNQVDGIPTPTQLDFTYDNYINLNGEITGKSTRRPVTAVVTMYAITRTTIDYEIVGLSPDTSALRDEIDTAIETYLLGKEPYILGVSVYRNDSVSVAEISAIVQNIAIANEATVSNVVQFRSGTPESFVLLTKGQKAKLGTVTYV